MIMDAREEEPFRGGLPMEPELLFWLMWPVKLNKEIGCDWVKSVTPEATERPVSGFKANTISRLRETTTDGASTEKEIPRLLL